MTSLAPNGPRRHQKATRARVLRAIPQILDGPWHITVSDGAELYAWITGVPGEDTRTERYARTTTGFIPWLKSGRSWTIAKTTPTAVQEADLFRYHDLEVTHSGAIPAGDPPEPVMLAQQPSVGTREVTGFHEAGWYDVVDSGTTGDAGLAFMKLTDNGDGTFEEALHWRVGFHRPHAGHVWTLTRRDTVPTPAELEYRQKKFYATITI